MEKLSVRFAIFARDNLGILLKNPFHGPSGGLRVKAVPIGIPPPADSARPRPLAVQVRFQVPGDFLKKGNPSSKTAFCFGQHFWRFGMLVEHE